MFRIIFICKMLFFSSLFAADSSGHVICDVMADYLFKTNIYENQFNNKGDAEEFFDALKTIVNLGSLNHRQRTLLKKTLPRGKKAIDKLELVKRVFLLIEYEETKRENINKIISLIRLTDDHQYQLLIPLVKAKKYAEILKLLRAGFINRSMLYQAVLGQGSVLSLIARDVYHSNANANLAEKHEGAGYSEALDRLSGHVREKIQKPALEYLNYPPNLFDDYHTEWASVYKLGMLTPFDPDKKQNFTFGVQGAWPTHSYKRYLDKLPRQQQDDEGITANEAEFAEFFAGIAKEINAMPSDSDPKMLLKIEELWQALKNYPFTYKYGDMDEPSPLPLVLALLNNGQIPLLGSWLSNFYFKNHGGDKFSYLFNDLFYVISSINSYVSKEAFEYVFNHLYLLPPEARERGIDIMIKTVISSCVNGNDERIEFVLPRLRAYYDINDIDISTFLGWSEDEGTSLWHLIAALRPNLLLKMINQSHVKIDDLLYENNYEFTPLQILLLGKINHYTPQSVLELLNSDENIFSCEEDFQAIMNKLYEHYQFKTVANLYSNTLYKEFGFTDPVRDFDGLFWDHYHEDYGQDAVDDFIEFVDFIADCQLNHKEYFSDFMSSNLVEFIYFWRKYEKAHGATLADQLSKEALLNEFSFDDLSRQLKDIEKTLDAANARELSSFLTGHYRL